MTADDLKAIEARLEAAEPGPWAWNNAGGKGGPAWLVGVAVDKEDRQLSGYFEREDFDEETGFFIETVATYTHLAVTGDEDGAVSHHGRQNAEFIAHAPTDVRTLLTRVRELEQAAQLTALETAAGRTENARLEREVRRLRQALTDAAYAMDKVAPDAARFGPTFDLVDSGFEP